jgi:hypothetical protein
MTPSFGVRIARVAGRVALRCYPRSFRDERGAAFIEIAEDRWVQERHRRGSAVAATLVTCGLLASDTWQGRRLLSLASARPTRRRLPMFDRPLTLVRHAVRGWRRTPTVSFTTLISLATSIGATTAIFAVVNAVFLAPAPGVAAMEHVIEICRTTNGSGCDVLSYKPTSTYPHTRER